jgi:hypothetical protein
VLRLRSLKQRPDAEVASRPETSRRRQRLGSSVEGVRERVCQRFAVLVELNDEAAKCVICGLPKPAHSLSGLRLLTLDESLEEAG